MKVMTILGTRPEIIRLCLVMNKLDQLCTHVMVHTGQNYDRNLYGIFYEQLKIRQTDYVFESKAANLMEQVGTILAETEKVFMKEKPDCLLLLGDTNSALTSIVAKRMGIPVYHMEAGNRCYDDRVPEEVNRRIIDHSSDILMPYTERSRMNLLREGIDSKRVYVTGNPIYEVIKHFEPEVEKSDILKTLGVEKGKYFLVTMHRAENVDLEERLKNFTTAFDKLQKEYKMPIIVSTHPRTKSKMQAFGISPDNEMIKFMLPFGFFEFINLEKNAYCVLSDSGTVQEECSIFGVPNVTIRDVTERPETIECGSNILSGGSVDSVLSCVKTVLSLKPSWQPPKEYIVENVSDIVVRIVLGYLHRPR